MSDRGMVKWMPYQSLVEQSSFLTRMRYEKNKRPRPHISSDRAREINEILVTYEGEEVAARYYHDGYLYDLIGTITKIDALYRRLWINGILIPFPDLIDLQR